MKVRKIKPGMEFRRNGMIYSVVSRIKSFCLVVGCHHTKTFQTHEIWRILKANKPHPMSKEDWDLVEYMPATETWGTNGWTYCSETEAKEAFERKVAA